MWGWLSSGLFLGWSVGASVAANIFGTAVASRMIRFATAARLCAIFVILGGVVNGPAAMDTLGQLANIDAPAAAFAVALAAAVGVAWMVGLGLPASASQSAVGALIGYRFLQQGAIDVPARRLLGTLVIAWAACPLLAAAAAFLIYKLTARAFRRLPMPLLLWDQWLRLGLLAVGCYGAWAFGGNNMANVVSFYTRLELFAPVRLGPWTLSQSQLLALLGGLAISSGVATCSRRVMLTVGRDLVKLDAVTAFISILAGALVLDFFAHSWDFGAFAIPAIPVSISQALVGSVLGLGAARGVQTIRLAVLRNIVIGWTTAPIISAALAYLSTPIVMRFA